MEFGLNGRPRCQHRTPDESKIVSEKYASSERHHYAVALSFYRMSWPLS